MSAAYRVAAVQIATEIADVAGNTDKALAGIAEAASRGASLVVLPEMFNTGFFAHAPHADPGYLDLAESLADSATLERIGEAARRWGCWVVAPIVEREQAGVFYNTAALLASDGSLVGRYRKVHVPWSLTAYEKLYVRSGYGFPVFDTPFGKLGVQLCYDCDFPEGFRSLAVAGAELIVVPSCGPRSVEALWRRLCQVRAYENSLFLLGVGMTGRTDAEHHELVGNSLLADPDGEILASLGREEAVLVAEVDPARIEATRRRRFILRDRRPETYESLIAR